MGAHSKWAPHLVAFTGGGCDGEFLRRDGWGVTRDRSQARVFSDASTAARFMDGPRLLGLNRPARSVQIVPE